MYYFCLMQTVIIKSNHKKGLIKMKNNEWEYTIKNNGSIKILKYIGNEEVVKIPSMIDGICVTAIGVNVFNDKVLRTLYLPESVEYIEKYFFKYTNVSEKIVVAERNLVYSSNSGIVYEKDKSVLLYCPKSRSQVEVPKTVIKIADFAFYKCELLESVTLHDYIQLIGECAFYKNSKLTKIEMPENIEIISDGCFSDCSALEKITIPGNVYKIGNYAFEHCVNLKSITLSEKLEYIGDYAFHGCQTLDEIALPLSLKSIGIAAFLDCYKIKEMIIPPNCSTISSNAFYFCASAVVYYPCNSNYFIGRSAKVTCSKEKFIKLFPDEELAKKEKKDDVKWLNKNPNARIQMGYTMEQNLAAITEVYNPNNVSNLFDKKELLGKKVFISFEEIDKRNAEYEKRSKTSDEDEFFEEFDELSIINCDYMNE